MKTGLLVIATGVYARLAPAMLASAAEHFHPTEDVIPFLFTDADNAIADRQIFLAHELWPGPTLHRYHVFTSYAAAFSDCDFLFYCDVDMRFVAPVGPEILSPLTATLHPGFVTQRGTYETRPESFAYVGPDEGTLYYCGAFNGGSRDRYLAMAQSISEMVDADASRGICAVWNDESYLNRYLIDNPPMLTLSPSYCYPDDQPGYYQGMWREQYVPRIVAIAEKPR